jgi:prepilin-type N-terminal cleavage/methylation domain-containing protein
MNVQTKLKDTKGFTIIEVVLVLAIAGLIFLMVFIALPALQRNQRDSARKAEVGTIASAITTYQSNNRGQAPDQSPTGFGKYLDANTDTASGGSTTVITLPSGTTVTKFTSSVASTGTTPVTGVTTDNVVFVMGAKCATENRVQRGTTRQAAVIVQLETADAYFCQTV